MLTEFRHDLNAYLAALPGEHPATLAELITFNRDHGRRVLARFGQELFEQAEATGGDLGDAGYLAAREEAASRAREALDGPLTAHRLDAVVTLTANPAWLTDYLLGDHDVFHTSGRRRWPGTRPSRYRPGWVSGLPVGPVLHRPAVERAEADRARVRVRAGGGRAAHPHAARHLPAAHGRRPGRAAGITCAYEFLARGQHSPPAGTGPGTVHPRHGGR